jgi:hypothetical protein
VYSKSPSVLPAFGYKTTNASYIASLVVVIVLPFQIVDLNAVIDTARRTNPVGQPWRVLLATCGAFFQNQTTTFNCERLAFSRSATAAIKESNSASVSSVAFLLELIVTEGGAIRFVAFKYSSADLVSPSSALL